MASTPAQAAPPVASVLRAVRRSQRSGVDRHDPRRARRPQLRGAAACSSRSSTSFRCRPARRPCSGCRCSSSSAQMVYGSKRVWLPRVLTQRTISAETFRSIMDRDHPATGLDRAHDPAALLAVLAPARRPGDRHHRADHGDHRYLADSARQLAAGLLDRAARPGAVRARRHPVRARAAPSAWSPWRSSRRSSGLSSPQRLRCSTSCSSCSAAILAVRFRARSRVLITGQFRHAASGERTGRWL